MANIKSVDRIKLEKFLEMQGGYVCDFTNNTFAIFVAETIGVDIYDDTFLKGLSTSKASRLREFWRQESNEVVAKLLDEMLEYWKSNLLSGPPFGYQPFNEILYKECKDIVKRLTNDRSVDDAGALKPNSAERDFYILSQSLKENIEKGKFEEVLDRLHTFTVKYLRVLCKRRGITFDKSTSLNALIGGYVKFLKEKDAIESDMSMQILRSAIKVMETFDAVRNNQSLAHDNPLLNKEESWLILSHVSSTIRFLEAMETKLQEKLRTKELTNLKYAMNLDEAIYDQAMEDAAVDSYIQQEIDRRRGK